MKITYHAGRIEKVERGRVSASGNPTFWVYFIDGRAPVRTEGDSQVNHFIENFKEGQWIRYGVNRHGRMVSAHTYDTGQDN
jgi:hypothetical protein